MDEKQKLLKLKSEIKAAEQNLENAINHVRDYKELIDAKIENMETTALKKELKRRMAKVSK